MTDDPEDIVRRLRLGMQGDVHGTVEAMKKGAAEIERLRATLALTRMFILDAHHRAPEGWEFDTVMERIDAVLP